MYGGSPPVAQQPTYRGPGLHREPHNLAETERKETGLQKRQTWGPTHQLLTYCSSPPLLLGHIPSQDRKSSRSSGRNIVDKAQSTEFALPSSQATSYPGRQNAIPSSRLTTGPVGTAAVLHRGNLPWLPGARGAVPTPFSNECLVAQPSATHISHTATATNPPPLRCRSGSKSLHCGRHGARVSLTSTRAQFRNPVSWQG